MRRVIVLPLAISALLVGCPQSDIGFGEGLGAEEPLASGWEKDNSYSPTGTVLQPEEIGYSVVDEVCGGDRLAEPYVDRFLSPMFRDIAIDGDRVTDQRG